MHIRTILSFCVCMEQLQNGLIDFQEIWHLGSFTKTHQHIPVWLELVKSHEHFTWRPAMYFCTYLKHDSIIFEWKMFQKLQRKVKLFYSAYFFHKVMVFSRIKWELLCYLYIFELVYSTKNSGLNAHEDYGTISDVFFNTHKDYRSLFFLKIELSFLPPEFIGLLI